MTISFRASASSIPASASSGVAKLLDQLHRRLVRAAVQRAAQRADGAGDAGVEIGAGAATTRQAKVEALNSCSA